MGNVHSIRPDGAQNNNEEVDLEIDDTQNVQQMTETNPGQPAILVLSRSAELVETVRKAAPRGTPVSKAPDLDHAAETLSSLRPGVLVADTASTNDVAGMVAQLTQHFPDLVVVVAGKREDSASLMQLTAAGRIFRFLLTPLSHGQTKLTLEAAVAQHVDLVNSAQRKGLGASSGGESKSYLKGYLALGGALVVVIGGIWFAVSSMTRESDAPVVQNTAATQRASSELGAKPDPLKAELALAKEAFDAGRYLEPAGESALDLYRSALAVNPQSEAALAGIRSVVDKVLERAEAALLAEKLEDAIKNIETARDIDPKHPRLAFLDTQIARERERIKLTQAQEVGGKVRTLLAAATQRMQQDALVTPLGGSARDALVEARRLDPTDPSVAQAIRDLGQQIAEASRDAVAAGRLDEAQTLIAGARSLGTAGAALATVERQLADARANTSRAGGATQSATARRPATGAPAAASNDALIAGIRQRIGAGQLIDPKGDSARDLLGQLRAADASSPAIDELSRALSMRLLDNGKLALAAKAYERSKVLIAASREVGAARYNEAALTDAESQLAKVLADQAASANVVSAGALKRTRTVSPEYPDSARKKKIEGWVEVAFTVTPSGTVEDVQIRNASPADVFEEAAVRAIKQWRFEPVVRNGEKVSQRAMTRLRFAAE
ncbi:MAG TPA: energy transducer TonB [Steroidobacteraceae bacterium]|nr:energy transducer TonB [Steroidobacteraceae bacterium]